MLFIKVSKILHKIWPLLQLQGLCWKEAMLCCNIDVMVFYVVRLSYENSVGGIYVLHYVGGSLFGRGRWGITIMGKWLNHRTMPSGGNEHGIIPGLSVNEPRRWKIQ